MVHRVHPQGSLVLGLLRRHCGDPHLDLGILGGHALTVLGEEGGRGGEGRGGEGRGGEGRGGEGLELCYRGRSGT